MASSTLKLFLLLFPIFLTQTWASPTTTLHPNLTSIRSFCRTTPYPEACFDSLKLGISISISPNILNYLLQSLQVAISEATQLSDLFHNAGGGSGLNLVEKQKGSIQDCRELHLSTLTSLKRSLSGVRNSPTSSRKLADARAYLSAAMTNKNTCLEGLDSASGSLKPVLVDSTIKTYKHVSNSLSMLPKPAFRGSRGHKNRRRLLGAPAWLKRRDRRILDGEENNPNEMLVVAADGTANFTTITEAVNYAPSNSLYRTVIYVKAGVYEENVEIPSDKTNIVLLGDGSDVTLVTGYRSVGDGWTTFRSATLAVSGDGFLARDIAIENSAGPEKHQAVALRVNADLTTLYRCAVYGYQDTLYVHSFRQFYRECDIYGTIDFIFGNAAVVFQACDIVSRKPMPHQFTVITAQSRDSPDEDTGISIQNCSVIATEDLYTNSSSSKSYLGRPWRPYSRTVYLESYIDDFVDPEGWTDWSDADGDDLETLYYGEYNNYGPGSGTGGRVNWVGYHVMGYEEAYNFTVSQFIMGDAWLQSTSVPYDAGI
ncbi:probable pectinesterase/pectinesterase inhibitor 12 [Neltuma alba]|uniref:LOW QUALITY PROTEIN: probable pectinesterase/pectinesterase inhibitor 12 n=1 Tax=Neltuma alba TaxID=207710 RepID=UPI0010A3AF49|nr:LOW QUALITY PROTEIN: probable pectinesterase/pectinesterase inhibitor 12 [Prosopis alba]XP_028790534.1 probable pectinesterase/pectinesterase inhibitor 12 [Prosopis alba]